MNKIYQTRVCHENDKKHLPFLKSYKFLYQDPNYQALPYQAKAMYTNIANKQMRVLKSASKSYYIDKEGKHFVIYPINELEKDLNLSNSSAKRYKRTLIEFGLITTTNNGKRIYVNQPQLTDKSLTYDNEQKLSYFHMPKFFETNSNYKNASLLARLVYTLQKDRFTLTLSNVNPKKSSQYLDERGRVFCIYANKELSKMLNVCEQSIIKAKKELLALGLLKQRKRAIKESNRLYLYTPFASEQLKTEEKSEDNQPKEKKKKYVLLPPEKNQWVKYEVRYGSNMKSSNTELNNNINIKAQYISENDSQHLEVEMLKEQNTYLKRELDKRIDEPINEQDAIKKQLLKKFPSYISTIINAYTTDVHQVKRVMRIICGAKKLYKAFYKVSYTLEDVEREIGAALIRVNNKHKYNNKTIADVGNYLFESIKQVFIDQHQEDFENNRVPFSPDIGLCGDFELVYPEEIKSVG
ncbi:replication initiator protein A [Staphylococcus warneri]|uniref:Replication initiator A N-terminal domain-containing protein n=1 Tax=Staphylococcus warneri TaxID=1292 RepID=A0A8B2ZKG3_STAWA|nr:replication initiator protein A [Staphylococcus warneri]RGM28286.1 hypothetical protein DXC19_11405 [Staphylococcus warneri]